MVRELIWSTALTCSQDVMDNIAVAKAHNTDHQSRLLVSCAALMAEQVRMYSRM